MVGYTPTASALTLVVLVRGVWAFIPSQSRAYPLHQEPARHVPLFSSQQKERRVGSFRISSASGGQGEESSTDSADAIASGAGRVSVEIVMDLPYVSSASEARDAWIEHHWEKGGGLPILSVQRDTSTDGTMRRLIAPIMMEEVADLSKESPSDSLSLQYRVTKPGPAFAPDLIDGSHLGAVSFVPNNASQGYQMIWSVRFDTKRWVDVYQKITEFTIGTAARTVAEATSIQRVLTLDATLKGVDEPIEARRNWLEFIWANGGGLPLPSPIMKGEILKEGGGMAKRELLRIPPLITEKIVSTSESSDGSSAELQYQLYRPGLTTFPFFMHTHHAKVSFANNDANSVDLHWEVEIRPFPIPIVKPLVEKLTEMTVATLIRNFVVHFAEPGAQVEIRPPRGNADLVGGVQSFGSVPKDTWIGGVLSAHLGDNRSTMEQVLTLIQPWTWGRSGNGNGSDEYVRYEWTDKQ